MKRGAILLLLMLLGGLPTASAQAVRPPVRVVASMSILADFVREVGGDRVEVAALVGPDSDVHVFEPTPADARQLAGAALVVINGLGLEGWLPRLVKASGTAAPTVVATAGIVPIAETGDQHPGAERAVRREDPHGWQSVGNAKLYVENIRAGLAQVDPACADVYRANATRYQASLDALDREIRAGLAAVPPGRREVITTHDAFGYFGAAYGLRFIAPQGVSTEGEASAADVARIIRQIRASKIKAVFLENISDPRLAQRIAKESGARIGDKVYSDALSGRNGPAATYLDMMRHNLRAFLAALSE